ncbi:MAG: hypothetical protein ACYTXF_35005 [Nostoc sp.]
MLIAQICNQDISQPGLRFLSAFGDDEKLRTLRQMAEGRRQKVLKLFVIRAWDLQQDGRSLAAFK